MGTKVRIEFPDEGWKALRAAASEIAQIEERAQAIAAAAGEGFEVEMIDANWGGAPRRIAVVSATTTEAMKAEAEDKALSSAIDAGR